MKNPSFDRTCSCHFRPCDGERTADHCRPRQLCRGWFGGNQ
ncbi:hypothetical protein ACFGXR_01970 [Pasteurella multocida]|nr:hypothetical protein [Pasteurella multocida]MEB3497973.1 hypothetical protein [Pasteurella multocida]